MMKLNFRKIAITAMFGFGIITTGYVLHENNNNHHHDNSSTISEHHMKMMDINDNITLVRDGRTVTVQPGDTLEISSEGADLSYDITEIRAQAGSELTIKYNNTSTMPHNILFVNSDSDINPVGIASLQAYENEYIPENEMDRIFGYSSLAVPGQTVYVTITVPEETGSYPYICTYPGHFTQMQGRLISR